MYNHIDDSTLGFYESITYHLFSIYVQCRRSALLLASKNGHEKVAKHLLEKGANINDKYKVRYMI